ncbi:hypothetical protein [Roseibacillus persicicus]|uniref:hypothetical protein n=1 Tax=Roseibacillus persicicus TaxID=454148 RepID=UPI00280CE533|nr:hypothetical protein [Roseibacillus persicicus]MDQ8191612.1 hypothetical protein [Roseibacillus persicicus]
MKRVLLLSGILLVGCGPQGELALPEQNVAERFAVKEGFRPSWTWTSPGGPAVLALAGDGPHEMYWSVEEKSLPGVRRSRLASLQTLPRFFSQGPAGVREVRFSPSGKTILAHEYSPDGLRFQTVVFQLDDYTGGWKSRRIDLAGAPETKLRKLDDRSKVPALIAPAVPPKILRLDDGLVIYEVAGKTQSRTL